MSKLFAKSQINLPFPYPMLNLNGNTIWPFKDEGFLIGTGQLINEEKLVAIEDLAMIVALNKMGFFGVHSNREIIYQNNTKFKANKSRFTVGFYSLKSIEIPSPFENFSEDINRLDSEPEQEDGDCTPKITLNSLKLSLEEAYFLSYVFGLLKILKNETEYYNLEELWSCFCKMTNENDYSIFAGKFAAYYYFRSIGYVVRNGYKFGVDYLLYEDGPPFNHSLYSILIEHCFEYEIKPDTRPLNYNEISAMNRISKNSNKDFIICKVIIPENVKESLIEGPNCIKYFKLTNIHISREDI